MHDDQGDLSGLFSKQSAHYYGWYPRHLQEACSRLQVPGRVVGCSDGSHSECRIGYCHISLNVGRWFIALCVGKRACLLNNVTHSDKRGIIGKVQCVPIPTIPYISTVGKERMGEGKQLVSNSWASPAENAVSMLDVITTEQEWLMRSRILQTFDQNPPDPR